MFKKLGSKKIVSVIALILVALVSVFLLSDFMSSPETYKNTLKILEENEIKVAGVTFGATAVATALAAIPSDATTPIANHILEVSGYLIIATCVIFLEKSLLTAFGFVSFAILIPAVCLMFIIYIFSKNKMIRNVAVKILAFALVITFIVPVSVGLGNLMTEANKEAIDKVSEESVEIVEESEESSWFSKVANGASAVKDKGKELVGNVVDAVALFIVSTCLIPILVVLFIMWLLKMLFGITIDVPKVNPLPRLGNRKKVEQNVIETQEVKESDNQ